MNTLSKLTASSVAIAFASLFINSVAFANPPYYPNLTKGGNKWTITFYDDTSPTHNQWATQTLCFYDAGTQGTHQSYNWVSISYRDWNGRATQEGDQIFMHGDFQWPWGVRDGGHDGMEWQLTTVSYKDFGFGHWKEWVEDGRFGNTIGWGNTRLQRVGYCRYKTLDEAVEAGANTLMESDLNSPSGVNHKQ